MRRVLGLMMVVGLLIGGASACGSSSGSSKSSSTTEASGGGGSTTSSNKAVQDYCKAVDAFVKKYKDGGSGNASAMAADSKDLSDKAAALATAGLSADDATAVGDCTKRSTDVLTQH